MHTVRVRTLRPFRATRMGKNEALCSTWYNMGPHSWFWPLTTAHKGPSSPSDTDTHPGRGKRDHSGIDLPGCEGERSINYAPQNGHSVRICRIRIYACTSSARQTDISKTLDGFSGISPSDPYISSPDCERQAGTGHRCPSLSSHRRKRTSASSAAKRGFIVCA